MSEQKMREEFEAWYAETLLGVSIEKAKQAGIFSWYDSVQKIYSRNKLTDGFVVWQAACASKQQEIDELRAKMKTPYNRELQQQILELAAQLKTAVTENECLAASCKYVTKMNMELAAQVEVMR